MTQNPGHCGRLALAHMSFSWQVGGKGWREHLLADIGGEPGIAKLLAGHDDAALHRLMTNLAGHDIEAMLDSDIDGLLKIDKLDPRVENTVHWDAVQFDVQIMRLDEWVEETWSEELADDLLLKPSMLEIGAEEEEEPHEPAPRGRRRGPQRRRRGRGRGSEETGRPRREGADRVFDEAGIGVSFRKKE